jgi:radical SAM/Cys-rich protein
MSAESCNKTLSFFESNDISTIELTGGAPELNPNFKDMVRSVRAMGKHAAVRSNLTVLFEDGLEGLPQFLAENRVELVCSLPCYLETNVDSQRGEGAYKKSIAALRMLNGLGYGEEGSGLPLYLVYNPGGAFLPGDQAALEADYRSNLEAMHGVTFSQLYTITNMPIGKFAKQLQADGTLDEYMSLLKESVSLRLLDNVMCRQLISVGWDGRVFDCDFNQALNLPAAGGEKRLWERSLDEIVNAPITLGEHCYGCIAGRGSSCCGILN